jgi:hypothetical protein
MRQKAAILLPDLAAHRLAALIVRHSLFPWLFLLLPLEFLISLLPFSSRNH